MSEGLSQFTQEDKFDTIKLLSGKSVGVRKWRMKEEKDFLFAIETKLDDQDHMINECVNLAKKCVDKPVMFEHFSRNDILNILRDLRIISKGQEVDFTYHCVNEECPTFRVFDEKKQEETGLKGQGNIPLEAIVDLKADLKLKVFDPKPVIVGDYKIYPKEISWTQQRTLETRFIDLKKQKYELNKFNWHFIMSCISAIEKDEKKIENFDNVELEQFLDNLSTDEFNKLSDGIGLRLSEFSVDKKVRCPDCGNESDVIYEELFSLLVF